MRQRALDMCKQRTVEAQIDDRIDPVDREVLFWLADEGPKVLAGVLKFRQS
jgi:hypothetical protein